MPSQKRFKTSYPGVYYIKGKSVGSNKVERIYYIMYRKNGRQIHEKAGRQFQDDMTPARASKKRARRIDGEEISNKAQREEEQRKKVEKAGRWTVDRLFKAYIETRPDGKSKKTDIGRYGLYLKPKFRNIEPKNILPLDVDRLRITLLKKKSPQTVKHVLNLLTWIINFGVKKNLCPGLNFHIQKPTVNNVVTEDLNPEQMQRLIDAIDAEPNTQTANLMRMVLYTGMRRGELLKLRWKHINFDRGFISIVDPKGGPDQKIPLNDAAREVLEFHPKTSEFVFPGIGGRQRVSSVAVNEVKKRAGLPQDFRPLHGLRHVYASMLASSGQVDLYTLQKLLTHKSPLMTQRYAHLRDEALKRASDLAGDIINRSASSNKKEKVVNLKT